MNVIVGIADMKSSSRAGDVLVTHGLGSCLGIAVWDPESRSGALLHAMLPDSTIDPDKALESPFVFIDTGVPRLFRECYRLGGEKSRLVVKVAGGANCQSFTEDDYFQIGRRNFVTLRKLLWKNNVLIKAYDVGGTQSRTMTLEVGTGVVSLRVNGQSKAL